MLRVCTGAREAGFGVRPRGGRVPYHPRVGLSPLRLLVYISSHSVFALLETTASSPGFSSFGDAQVFIQNEDLYSGLVCGLGLGLDLRHERNGDQ